MSLPGFSAQANDQTSHSLEHINPSHSWPLCAAVELKWGGWLQLATVTLRSTNCAQLKQTARHDNLALAFDFHRKIPGSYFRKQANSSFRENWQHLNKSDLIDRASSFNNHYLDIEDGDQYEVVRHNNRSLSLWKNQRPIHSIMDGELASLYFDIWLGKKPGIPRLKKHLKEAMDVN